MTDWGEPGGATAPGWGDTVKLHVWLALARGNRFTLGPDPFDQLDRGNTLGRASDPAPNPSVGAVGRLWVDVTPDVLDVAVTQGATTAEGVFARPEAGTATLTLADPDRRFDPLNQTSPFQYEGSSRLVPGTPVLVHAEAQRDGQVARYVLFAGAVDSWSTPWTAHRAQRRTKVIATDATRALVARSRPDTSPPVGEGDTVTERLERILTVYAGPPLAYSGTSPRTLAATALKGTAWAQVNAVVDAEVGYATVGTARTVPDQLSDAQALTFHPRSVWTAPTPPVVDIACPLLVDAQATALDDQVRNVVTAQRDGGAPITVRSEASVARYGEHTYARTGLGLRHDHDVAEWARFVLQFFAFPRPTLTEVTLHPAADPYTWPDVLGITPVADRVHVRWSPPGTGDTYDVTARVVGVTHAITRHRWAVTWALGAAETAGRFFTLGPDPFDRLDASNRLAFAHTAVPELATEAGDLLVTESRNQLVTA